MIMWKNVWYNLAGRIPQLYDYYRHGLNKSVWRCYYYPHLQPWTKAQEDHLYREFEIAMDINPCVSPVFKLRYPRSPAAQPPSTPANTDEDNTDDQGT